MNKKLELPKEVYQREDGRWCKLCSECGEPQDYLRRNYAIQSFLLGKTCKKCSNRKTENCHRGFIGEIRTSWFQKFESSARLRGLEFSITAKYIQKLWEEKDKKCALSGLPLDWQGVSNDITASIDRIDSSKGYIEDNVQVIHKHVNMMKQSYGNDYFIALCRSIARHNSVE